VALQPLFRFGGGIRGGVLLFSADPLSDGALRIDVCVVALQRPGVRRAGLGQQSDHNASDVLLHLSAWRDDSGGTGENRCEAFPHDDFSTDLSHLATAISWVDSGGPVSWQPGVCYGSTVLAVEGLKVLGTAQGQKAPGTQGYSYRRISTGLSAAARYAG